MQVAVDCFVLARIASDNHMRSALILLAQQRLGLAQDRSDDRALLAALQASPIANAEKKSRGPVCPLSHTTARRRNNLDTSYVWTLRRLPIIKPHPRNDRRIPRSSNGAMDRGIMAQGGTTMLGLLDPATSAVRGYNADRDIDEMSGNCLGKRSATHPGGIY